MKIRMTKLNGMTSIFHIGATFGSAPTLSTTVGIPKGLLCPFGLGMYTRRTGYG